MRVRCSLSAVSKPNFARKYALESSRRDLHNALLCTVLKAHIFVDKSLKILPNFAKLLPNFAELVRHSLDFGKNLPEFCRNLPNFAI